MKKLLLVLLILFSIFSYSQQYMLPAKLVDQYLVDGNKKDIIIETTIDNDNFYEIKLQYNDKTSTFKLKPLTFPNFKSKFKDAIVEVITLNNPSLLKTSLPSDDNVQNEIAYVFTQFVTYYNTQEVQPEVASIFLKDKIPIYFECEEIVEGKKEKKKTKLGYIENTVVELSFYGGFIEKIQVNGKVKGIDVTFNNKYSIGISSTKNIKEIGDYRVYSDEKKNQKLLELLAKIQTKEVYNNLSHTDEEFNKEIEKQINLQQNPEVINTALFEKTKISYLNNVYNDYVNNLNELISVFIEDPQFKRKKGYVSMYIHLDDIIRYIKKVDVNANDISPVPQLVILDKNQKQTKLFKEESSKLFEAIVYTDFLGVFDEQNPNGIIQTEVNKTFNLNTKRRDSHIIFFEGIGSFQSFNAQFQFSKIEKNNKFLLPSSYEIVDESGSITEIVSFYSPITLLQHRNFAIGGMLNIVTLENQNSKMNMFLDLGFLFGRSGIKETEEQVEGTFVNNLEIPIALKLQLLPEKRISFSVSDKISWFETFDSDINLRSIENNLLQNKNRFLNSFNLDLALDISSSGKLFLRYKLIHELDNINTNFSQLQFGYSFYLLQKNGVKKNN